MENANENVHPGLEILRRVIPNTAQRRAWVRAACSQQSEQSETMPVSIEVTPEEKAQIDAFIEWI